ncbi:MAG TPA: SUMF1/EgtB/PvdO family nonheme iron enzyme [Polyangiaceae bacterium]|nr:SUMF1/EgtB/PvdO family nonheme iron enzyme [Polyangiaceae bacterium]
MNRQGISKARFAEKTSNLSSLATLLMALSVAACGGGGGGNDPGGAGGSGGSSGDAGTVPLNCTSSGDRGEMVSVPAGEFLMGCNSAVDNQCEPREQPGRQVTLNAFQIDKTEVTQDQYTACVDAGACAEPACEWNCEQMDLPATCILWADAKKYCEWAGKRLPSEAEWEKAARGTDGRKFPWGNEAPSCELLNMVDCVDGASPAGAYPDGASPYGALDMAGNMVEMVADWYDERYYQSAPSTNPKGPGTGTTFSGRGGGWLSAAVWHRTSQRDWYGQDKQGKSLGFRCAQ